MTGISSQPLSPLAELEQRVSEIEEKRIGPWIKPESFSPKVEPLPGAGVLGRLENNGNYVRLKGLLESKEAIPQFSTLFTLPPSLRPIDDLYTTFANASADVSILLTIEINGVVSTRQEIPIKSICSFVGVTYQTN